jgi:hypothetical protein
MRIALALAAALTAPAAEKAEISQDIVVRARASGAAVLVAPPAASKPVVDEVLRSLALGRGATAPAAERVAVEPELARFARPFPEPPFLAFSPANVEALYDEWTFEVLDDRGEFAWRSSGVGLLREALDWDGTGPGGRLAAVPGRSYRYRFTGRRAGRAFAVESAFVPLRSFTHREYGGETRLECALGEIFEGASRAPSKGGARWLDAFGARLRAAEPRSDGTYRLELRSREPAGALAKARAAAVAAALARVLVVSPEAVRVERAPAERGEALSALVPPSRGPSLRIE